MLVGLAALLLAGCSASTPAAQSTTSPTGTPSASSTSGATPSATAGTPTTAPGRTMTVTVTGRLVTPAPATVNLRVGEQLRLTVTSDHDDELHAHGFDVEKPLQAGVPLTVTLSTREPGVYDIEMHHPELRLFQVAVR